MNEPLKMVSVCKCQWDANQRKNGNVGLRCTADTCWCHMFTSQGWCFPNLMSFRVVTPCLVDLWGASQLSEEDWLQTATRPWMQSSTTNQWDWGKKHTNTFPASKINPLNSYFIWYKICVFFAFSSFVAVGPSKKVVCVPWFAPIGPRLADEVKRAAELGFTPLVVCNGHAKVWKPIVIHGFLGQIAQTRMQDDHRSLILYLSQFLALFFSFWFEIDLKTKRKHVGVIGVVFFSSFLLEKRTCFFNEHRSLSFASFQEFLWMASFFPTKHRGCGTLAEQFNVLCFWCLLDVQEADTFFTYGGYTQIDASLGMVEESPFGSCMLYIYIYIFTIFTYILYTIYI